MNVKKLNHTCNKQTRKHRLEEESYTAAGSKLGEDRVPSVSYAVPKFSLRFKAPNSNLGISTQANL
jgi:hypothetical protein